MFYRFLYGYIVIYNYDIFMLGITNFIIIIIIGVFIIIGVYDIPFRKHRPNKSAYESIRVPSFQQAVLQLLQGCAGNSYHLF